jgi:hypothetical protein
MPPDVVWLTKLGLGGFEVSVMRSVYKTAACPSDARWPRLWAYSFIVAAGVAGWLGILMGLRAIF